MKICSSKLTTCGVSDDGEVLELGFPDGFGEVVSVRLPFDQAQSIVMTLPHLLARALRQQIGRESARYVFRIGDWSVESAEEDQNCHILTVATVDGFDVSFGISLEMCSHLGASLRHESEKVLDATRSPGGRVAWKN
jgi:hypothetical protein